MGSENIVQRTVRPWKISGQGFTCHIHFFARDYDPELGRFLSMDVIPDPNRYAYARNNPLGYVDPLGLFWIKKGLKAIGKGIKNAGKAVGNAVSDAAEWTQDNVVKPVGHALNVAAGLTIGKHIDTSLKCVSVQRTKQDLRNSTVEVKE